MTPGRGGYSDSDSHNGKKNGSSDDSDSDGNVKVKGKSGKGMGCFGYFKVLNCLLYLSTLCIAIGYFRSTKYESKFVYYMF